MASWTYANGNFLPIARRSTVLRPSITSGSNSNSSSLSGANTVRFPLAAAVQTGDFVELTNKVTNLNPPIVKATYASPVVLGVARSISSQALVATKGVAFAWVIQGEHDPPLSGFYSKSINGIHQANVVVDIQEGNTFTISATKGKEIDELKERFDALTST